MFELNSALSHVVHADINDVIIILKGSGACVRVCVGARTCLFEWVGACIPVHACVFICVKLYMSICV